MKRRHPRPDSWLCTERVIPGTGLTRIWHRPGVSKTVSGLLRHLSLTPRPCLDSDSCAGLDSPLDCYLHEYPIKAGSAACARVCVCLYERERERERESVCVCVRMCSNQCPRLWLGGAEMPLMSCGNYSHLLVVKAITLQHWKLTGFEVHKLFSFSIFKAERGLKSKSLTVALHNCNRRLIFLQHLNCHCESWKCTITATQWNSSDVWSL